MDGKKMKIIVTGGCGFIGSNLVDALVNQGHSVTVIDDLSSDAHDQFYFNSNATYYNYDITNHHLVNGVFERHEPEYVFHLAAEARIQNCILNPSRALNVNTFGTQNVLDAAKKVKTKRVMFSSTSAIYGLTEKTVQREIDSPDCLNAYSYSKFFSEGLCKMYSTLYEVDTVCFRYFNVYGPRQPKRGSYAPVIGVFSRQKKTNQLMTIVGDGLQTRDYVHVSDVVSANIAAMNHKSSLCGKIMNVGTGVSYSVLDVAKMMGGEYTHIEPRTGEARHTCADTSIIKETLDWQSTKSLKQYMENKEYDT
jgi:UDP-glucose 4-epimerase